MKISIRIAIATLCCIAFSHFSAAQQAAASPPATIGDVAWLQGYLQAQGFGLKDRGLGFADFPAARLDGFFFDAARSAAP